MADKVEITVASSNSFVEGMVLSLSGCVGGKNGLYVVTGVIDDTKITLRHLGFWGRIWESLKRGCFYVLRWSRKSWWVVEDWFV